jgi:predicted phage-related endonuclease
MINVLTYDYETKLDWLRNRGIGGSDCASLLNESKWQSLNDLYDRLTSGVIKELKGSERMEEGTKAEDHIRKLWGLEHKEYKLEEPPVKGYWLIKRADYPLMTLTPDGLLNNRTGFLEIKDCEIKNGKEAEMWQKGYLPAQYLNQCLWYFVVINTLTFGILHARLKFMNYDGNKYTLDHIAEYDYLIERKVYKKDIAKIEKTAINFIEKNVLKKIRPATILKL